MNILILYDKFSTFTNNVYDHLNAFQKHSSFSHAYCHADGTSPSIPWDDFDAVVIHYSLRIPHGALHPKIYERVQAFEGVKILFVQDEYEGAEKTRKAIEELGIDIVFTCVPNEYRELIYPRARFPDVEFVESLTGYVSDDLRELSPPPVKDRPVVIGYRGRKLPFWYGDLGQEKQRIAERVKAYCIEHGIGCDIEWDDEHRIYGDAWLEFLKCCKATLGTESGANLFDDDGTLRSRFSNYLKQYPEASYREARAVVVGDVDEKPIMNQVSPRIFEAIACGTAMILFEGKYSGVVVPYRHYLPLKKDFSNLDEIIGKLKDDQLLQAMVDHAYRDVILSGIYSYEKFIESYDAMLQSRIDPQMVQPGKVVNYSSLVTPVPIRMASARTPGWALKIWRKIPLTYRKRLKSALLH